MLHLPSRRLARALTFIALGLGLVVASCEPAAAPTSTRTVAASPEPAAEPARAGSPLGGLRPASGDDAAFAGVVTERLAAGSYTYLRVHTERGDRWVATMGEGAPVGQRVHVKNMGTRHDFHSRRLGRRFEELAFGIVREA